MLKTVPIRALKPNPFRRLDEYPIVREKVDALKESIASTGFWGTIVARPAGDHYEIAFGHHRLIALQETCDPDDGVEVIIRKLSNEQMLQMMARENMEEWGTSAWVELETIRAVIDAYDKREIDLPPVPKDTRKDAIRYVSHGIGTRPYTKGTVAEFLGWTRKHDERFQPNHVADIAFKALDMIEKGFLKEADLRGLSRRQMQELVDGQWSIFQANERIAENNRRLAEDAERQAAAAEKEADRRRLEKRAEVHKEQAAVAKRAAEREAKRFGKEGAEAMRSGEGVRAVRKMAEDRKPTVQNGRIHRVDDLANKIAKSIERFANGDDGVSADFAFLIENSNDLSARAAAGLDQSIAALIKRLEKMRRQLKVPV